MHYRPEIDGLRAIAVLAVIFSHVGIEAFAGGFIGVDVFFVISGYLITSIILRDLDAGTFSLVGFYERRAKRILPALFFVLFCTVILAWIALVPLPFRAFSGSLLSAVFSVSNFYFLAKSDYFAPEASELPLIHTWSLGVEEQFYLLFPLALLVLKTRSTRLKAVVIATVVSMAICVVGARLFPTANYYLLPTRAWEMMFGALAAFALCGKKPKGQAFGVVAGLLMIGASVYLFSSATPFPSEYSLLPVIGTLLIILFGNERSLIGGLLSSVPMVALGKISFSAYLWHQPIFVFLRLQGADMEALEVQLPAIVLVFCLAALTYFLVEKPMRYAAITLPKLIGAVVVVGLCFTAFSIGGIVSRGYPKRVPEEITKLYERNNFSYVCMQYAKSMEYEIPHPDCVTPLRAKKVALWGDSTSSSLAQSLKNALPLDQVQFAQVSYSGCAPIPSARSPMQKWEHHCELQISATLEYLLREEFDVVILAAAWVQFFEHEQHEIDGVRYSKGPEVAGLLREKYLELLRRFRDAGIAVYVIDPFPWTKVAGIEHVAKRLRIGHENIDITIPLDEFDSNIARALSILDTEGMDWVTKIRPRDEFCDLQAKSCFLARSSVPVLADRTHYSEFGADFIAQAVRGELSRDGIIH